MSHTVLEDWTISSTNASRLRKTAIIMIMYPVIDWILILPTQFANSSIIWSHQLTVDFLNLNIPAMFASKNCLESLAIWAPTWPEAINNNLFHWTPSTACERMLFRVARKQLLQHFFTLIGAWVMDRRQYIHVSRFSQPKCAVLWQNVRLTLAKHRLVRLTPS